MTALHNRLWVVRCDRYLVLLCMCCCWSILHPTDYVFDERKFGGNAQAITSKRWLHHTSLLWDYDAANMAVLMNPKKQPAYRQVTSTQAPARPLFKFGMVCWTCRSSLQLK